MSKASQLRQKAQVFLQKGKTDKAIEEYKKLLTIEARNPNLYNELGDIYLRSNDRVQAVSAFEKASLNYEKVALYNNAVAVCKKILRIVPNRLDTIYKLGEIKAKQKILGEAESYFSQYFDAVVTDSEGNAEGVQGKVETILLLVPDCEGIWSKASDVFNHIGIKSRAAEILARLITRNAISGDPQRLNFYRSRLDLLKQALKREELEKVEKIITGHDGTDAQGVSKTAGTHETPVSAGVPGAVVPAAGASGKKTAPPAAAGGPSSGTKVVSGEGISLTDYASDMSGEGTPADRRMHAGEIQDGKSAVDGVDVETSSGVGAREDVLASESGGGDVEATECGVSPSEDLSDLLDEEDAQIENESSIKNLAEEITSDVEEDDFRSHYDLGMAYIEMGLFADAVKELQISARSEQLQLQSLEMVGHCFISMSNPRLAVKQLERGLEISQISGGDSMGIHYNLGLAYEALDDMDKAREHYEEVYIVDVTFRDISDKMKKFSTVS